VQLQSFCVGPHIEKEMRTYETRRAKVGEKRVNVNYKQEQYDVKPCIQWGREGSWPSRGELTCCFVQMR